MVSIWFHVESKSETCARSGLVGWIGTVETSSTDKGTAATTKTMRNASEELSFDRAKAVSSAGSTATYLALDRPDNVHSIRQANQDIAKPKVRTEARLKRVARYLLCEPEKIWKNLYQEMPSKLVVRTDANWTGQDSEDQKYFSCVVVRFGDPVIDVVCAKQDVVALSAPESELYALTAGKPHGIRSQNIFCDLHVELIVRLETDLTSVSGICPRRGVGRLRHLHKKELWLQDQIAAKKIQFGRVTSEDNEAHLGTKYLERNRIKKCVTMMRMLFARSWAGEQLPMVSGTEVIIGEVLIEGQRWMIGVVLFVRYSRSGTA